MDTYSLVPSDIVLQQLQFYMSIIPLNRQAFIDHFDAVWPGMRDTDEDTPWAVRGALAQK
jgi:hypothetical protein